MQTVFELYFEKQVILSISERDCSPEKRALLFREFYKHGATYFEETCDAIFKLSTKEAQGKLFIMPAGKPYIAWTKNHPDDFEMFSSDEIPPFRVDLHEQLIFFLERFSFARNNKVSARFHVDFRSTL